MFRHIRPKGRKAPVNIHTIQSAWITTVIVAAKV
jgi:hypothetical protein